MSLAVLYEFFLSPTTALAPAALFPPTLVTAIAPYESYGSLNVSWTTVSIPNIVIGYRLYRNNTLIYDGPATSFTDTGLSFDVTYTYGVSCYDASSIFGGEFYETTKTLGYGVAPFPSTGTLRDLSYNFSSSIINGYRTLNAVIDPLAVQTKNALIMDGLKFYQWMLPDRRLTLPIYVDTNAYKVDKSVMTNGNVFNIAQSNTSYCFRLLNTGANIYDGSRTVDFNGGGLKLPTNGHGDIIFAQPPAGQITREGIIVIQGKTMRVVEVNKAWNLVVTFNLN